MSQSVNISVNDEGDFRTAPATPVLLKRCYTYLKVKYLPTHKINQILFIIFIFLYQILPLTKTPFKSKIFMIYEDNLWGFHESLVGCFCFVPNCFLEGVFALAAK